jgi:hypothetical protein
VKWGGGGEASISARSQRPGPYGHCAVPGSPYMPSALAAYKTSSPWFLRCGVFLHCRGNNVLLLPLPSNECLSYLNATIYIHIRYI